ncbi:pyridoxal phosphate-dependent aminotransferase [bacterium]|nr:pyridoxal phosphate-dependent aminotransferase [bacterium]
MIPLIYPNPVNQIMFDSRLANVNSLEFSSSARILKASGKKITSLGLGEPIWSTPKEITSELSRQIIQNHFGYSSPYGNPKLRGEVLKLFLSANESQSLKPENLLITQGAKGALTLALESILEPGDFVAIVEPCYASYIPQAYLAAFNISAKSFMPEHLDSLCFEKLDAFLSKHDFKCLLISSPSNPTGHTLSFDVLSGLQVICKRHNIYLIIDEVYSMLYFGDEPPISAASLISSNDNVIVVNSFSKTYSMTAWRIGYLLAPPSIISHSIKIIQHELTCIPEFLQIAAAKFVEVSPSWLNHNLSLLRANLSESLKSLDSLRMSGLVSYTVPTGGMFIFIKVNVQYFDSDAFCSSLIKDTNIAMTPGKLFGSFWTPYLRISLSCDQRVFAYAFQQFICYLKNYIICSNG